MGDDMFKMVRLLIEQLFMVIVSFCYNKALFSVCFIRYLILWDF